MRKFLTTSTGAAGGWIYVQRETGRRFLSFSFDDLLEQIAVHRSSMAIPMPDGWREVVQDEMCDYNIADFHDPDHPQPFRSELEKMGRRLWEELHSYGMNSPWDSVAASIWLQQWESRLPNFEYCDCREGYHKLKSGNPPDLSSYDAFHSWGVQIHDLVNVKLGKPVWIAS